MSLRIQTPHHGIGIFGFQSHPKRIGMSEESLSWNIPGFLGCSLSYYSQGLYIPGGCLKFFPSTVCISVHVCDISRVCLYTPHHSVLRKYTKMPSILCPYPNKNTLTPFFEREPGIHVETTTTTTTTPSTWQFCW